MEYIRSSDPDAGMMAMADRISSVLNGGKKVLWLICGGSNIPTAAQAMSEIRSAVPEDSMKLLTVAQTDERYGPVGHPDSNWKQMQDEGFDFEGVRDIPILTGEALQDTVDEYERAIVPIFDEIEQAGGMIVGQFGMGTDGHIAGIQPHTPAVNSSRLVSGYEWKPFTRVTLTFPALMKIDAAYVFVFGESKRDAVTKLKAGELPLDEEPAQILKNMREVHFYSDLI